MYWKLAIQNIRRSLRDYIIYFVTLTLTAALMYSFLALGFSSDVLAMAENMSMLTTGILLMSALVAFMSSFVIGYAIRFMLGRRKKEFATYELIGMEAKTVRNLFLAENSIIGTGAFLLGSLVGTGLSGLLNQVVKNIFEVPHTYRVSFSLQAWTVTFLFFVLMYGFGIPGIKKRLETIPEQWEMAAGIAVRSTVPRKSNDGCYRKGVGCCQFADWIYSDFILRIVFKHYFYHPVLLDSCI